MNCVSLYNKFIMHDPVNRENIERWSGHDLLSTKILSSSAETILAWFLGF